MSGHKVRADRIHLQFSIESHRRVREASLRNVDRCGKMFYISSRDSAMLIDRETIFI